jgi:hypothetical protein
MERLTEHERTSTGAGIAKENLIDEYEGKGSISSFGIKALTKLADYEDLEEQGLLINLIRNIGDTVFVIAPKYCECENRYDCDDYDSEEYLITWCEKYCQNGYKGLGIIQNVVTKIEFRNNGIYYDTSKCGYRNSENIFLTKSEAEQKLKELTT